MTDETETQLLAREELFVAAYLANGGNGSAAARDAGYSEKSADVRANELLQRPRVRDAIQAARTRILTKYNISAESVLQEMAAIGFSRFSHYRYAKDGRLGLCKSAPESAAAAVKRVKRKITDRFEGRGESATPVRETEIEFELWNKDAQLRNLGDYLGLFKENRNLDGDRNPLSRLSRADIELLAVELIKKAAKNKKLADRGAAAR